MYVYIQKRKERKRERERERENFWSFLVEFISKTEIRGVGLEQIKETVYSG